MVGPAVDKVSPGRTTRTTSSSRRGQRSESGNPIKYRQDMKGATLCPVETETAAIDRRVDPAQLWKRYAKSGPGSSIEEEIVEVAV